MSNAVASKSVDFGIYYDLDTYLFGTVSGRFAEKGKLEAFDFFCIIIWKANRAKSKIARRLMSSGIYSDLDAAVGALTSMICAQSSPKERLRVLIENWRFLLPMSSAILTVLYPKDFTVYDIRVCEILGDFGWVKNKSRFDEIWEGYSRYIDAVKSAAPSILSLRDKDRWLWGRSFYNGLSE
jgi:hypothetical protein